MPPHTTQPKINVPVGWESLARSQRDRSFFCPACSTRHYSAEACMDPDARAVFTSLGWSDSSNKGA